MTRTDIQTLGILPSNTRAQNDAALSAILNTALPPLVATPGNYLFGSGHVHAGDFNIVFEPGARFDFAGSYGTIGLTITGSLVPLPAISSAYQDSRSVSFSSAPALSSEDIFILHDPRDYSWSLSRPLYNKGEMCTVRELSGSTVRLIRPLFDSYVPAYTNVYKLVSHRVYIKGMDADGSGITGTIRVSLCDRPVVEDFKGSGSIYQIIEFDRCHKPIVNAPRVQNIGTVAMFGLELAKDDYGVVLTNCQGGRVHEPDAYARRHAVAMCGDSNPGAIVNRDNLVIGGVLSNDLDSGVYSADMHGNMEFCGYEGVKIYGGAGMAGRNNWLRGNLITNQLNGSCVYAGEVQGGLMSMRDNEFITTGDPSVNSRGIINFGAPSIGVHTQYTLSIQIANNTIRADNASSGTSAVVVVNDGTDVNIDIDITDLMAVGDTNAMGAILRTSRNSGGAYSRRIVVDNVPGFPASTWLHNPADNAYANVPQRLQR